MYSMMTPEQLCAVAWTGPLDSRADAVISALTRVGLTIAGGRLKQEVVQFPGQPFTSTLLVRPSDLEVARSIVTQALVRAGEREF